MCACVCVCEKVSKREYDSCSLLTASNIDNTDHHHHHHHSSSSPTSTSHHVDTLILNCSSPLHRRRFTILFEPFQSIPNAPEYKPGMSYYFISESHTYTTLTPYITSPVAYLGFCEGEASAEGTRHRGGGMWGGGVGRRCPPPTG